MRIFFISLATISRLSGDGLAPIFGAFVSFENHKFRGNIILINEMNLEEIKKSALEAISSASAKESLNEIKTHYLGRKGVITETLKSLKDMTVEARREMGPKLQDLYREIEEVLEAKFQSMLSGGRKTDYTAPGKKVAYGGIHPLSKVMEDAAKIFRGLNFSVISGPELEAEYYNFDALNIPANHPAREMWDTFWIKGEGKTSKSNYLLRTHTSPVQVRFMEKNSAPFQIIVPGRVFRYEATDMSHEINFYQLEGLMVGKEINLANFKYIVEQFLKEFFASTDKKIEFRFRPSYFPFVEPGVEVDIKLKGRWLEVMGAGMVHRRVFEAVHYSPDEVQGFAFGVGIDRLAMIKYGVPDIRLFYSGDLRFLKQFKNI